MASIKTALPSWSECIYCLSSNKHPLSNKCPNPLFQWENGQIFKTGFRPQTLFHFFWRVCLKNVICRMCELECPRAFSRRNTVCIQANLCLHWCAHQLVHFCTSIKAQRNFHQNYPLNSHFASLKFNKAELHCVKTFNMNTMKATSLNLQTVIKLGAVHFICWKQELL